MAVVSTSAGAEGLGLERGKHLLIADELEGFATAVSTLLSDTRLRRTLAGEGRAHVLQHFRPEDRCARLELLVRSVLQRAVPRGP
jgi:glycosyltransferase involved in cell wall biosynthesis